MPIQKRRTRLMRRTFFKLCILFFLQATAQENVLSDQQIEDLTENKIGNYEDLALSDPIEMQMNKVSINECSSEDLLALGLLDPEEIRAIVDHRKKYGKFISLLELQVPEVFNPDRLFEIRDLFYIGSDNSLNETLINRILKSEKELSFKTKVSFVKIGDSAVNKYSEYPGSAESQQIRFRAQYQRKMIYGFSAEKDPGEKIQWNKKTHFYDYYSFYFLMNDLNRTFKTIAIGDFKASFGEGLVLGSAFSAGKSSRIFNVSSARQGILPNRSFDENNFFRGIALLIEFLSAEHTLIISKHRKDALVLEQDSVIHPDETIRSLVIDGYHRNETELDKKDRVSNTTFVYNFLKKLNRFKIGITGLYSTYGLDFENKQIDFDRYTPANNTFYKASSYCSWSFKNTYWFGEYAISENGNYGLITGQYLSLGKYFDLITAYRNFSKYYNTQWSGSFSERSDPSNEKGFYTGARIKPFTKLEVSLYFDDYQIPGYTFNTQGPVRGQDLYGEIRYSFNRQSFVYFRLRYEMKTSGEDLDDPPVQLVNKKYQYRIHLETMLPSKLRLKIRMERRFLREPFTISTPGSLIYIDLTKPIPDLNSNLGLRMNWFDIQNYGSRIYAPEGDVKYSWSVQQFYGSGFRCYILLKMDLKKTLKLQLKYAIMKKINYSVSTDPSNKENKMGEQQIGIWLGKSF